jgi:single-strand DNA-binding protein
MNENNVVVLRGRVAAEPVMRELASGAVVAQFDLAVADRAGTSSVPVAWIDPPPARVPAHEQDVVVLGSVRRRFFRAGGTTQSRTEVVAEHVVGANRRRAVERLLAATVPLLGTAG